MIHFSSAETSVALSGTFSVNYRSIGGPLGHEGAAVRQWAATRGAHGRQTNPMAGAPDAASYLLLKAVAKTLMKKALRCELIPLQCVYDLCYRLSVAIKTVGYKPDLIVAIARGGFVPARFLCDFLDLSNITCIKVEHYHAGAQKQASAYVKYPLGIDVRGQRVLVADDVNDTGETLVAALAHIEVFQPAELRTAVLHQKMSTRISADFVGEALVEWRWIIYPWAITEDVGHFLKGLDPQTSSEAEAKRQLRERYGIEITDAQLERVLALTDSLRIGQNR